MAQFLLNYVLDGTPLEDHLFGRITGEMLIVRESNSIISSSSLSVMSPVELNCHHALTVKLLRLRLY